MSAGCWQNPLVKRGVVSGAYSEATPFVLRDRLYRLENFHRSEEFPGQPVEYRFHEDGFRIRDVADDRIVSVPLLNHYFGFAFPWDGRVHVFAGHYGLAEPWWHIREIVLIASDDLVTWTRPQVVIRSENGERLFNTAVCHDGRRFVLLYETDDNQWPPFTFKYCESDDLVHWRPLPGALYGTDKYVGGPALYYADGWYYTLYLEDLGDERWETRVTRSTDLVHWQDAPPGRPVVTYDPTRVTNPALAPDVHERNASDAELCEWQGKTILYFNGGNQHGLVDLQWAEYDGPPAAFLAHFFRP
ncbi:hypothetical protein HQ590_03170 [bacterium]|nr:hypothetical protein [bacterium]